MNFKIKEGSYSHMGTYLYNDTVTFTFEGERESDCAIILYGKNSADRQIRIPAPKEYCVGSLRSVSVEHLNWRKYEYVFEVDGEIQMDPYARKIIGREKWADLRRADKNFQVRNGFDFEEFDWEREEKPTVTKADMVLYKLHTRGFSMDGGASGKKKGTFAAVTDHIPYFKKLGVTSLELMPVYEFEEYMFQKGGQNQDRPELTPEKINFWGYVEGNYFAPKASYASLDNASLELKELIHQLHKNGMECVLEFYFTEKINRNLMVEALRFWVKEYHVDGFHLLGTEVPVESIAQDMMLSRTKIFYDRFSDRMANEEKHYQNLYEYNDDFFYPARKMLNHMSGELEFFTGQMRKQRQTQGYVNYMACNNGFTLNDIFSYSEKHNEENGEQNVDGLNWNFSTNYGVEGASRKKDVMQIRKRQIMNAIAIVFLGQGVPLLWSGDEFANSQKGNNNAYCQDNKVGWINWNMVKRNCDITSFVEKMAEFRRRHPVIRRECPMQMTDWQHCGYPDLSYHCDNAWVSGFEPNRQSVGVLYCGERECRKEDQKELRKSDKIYIGFNFHVGKQELALPQLPKGEVWCKIMDTGASGDPFLNGKEQMMAGKHLTVNGQTISILVSRECKAGPKAARVRRVVTAGPVKQGSVKPKSRGKKGRK